MLNNDEQRQLDNLKSQIPILSKRIQNFVAEINKIEQSEEGGVAKQKIEDLTAQVTSYQERMKKIDQAITLIMKTRAEGKAEEIRESEGEQRERGKQERTRARQKSKQEELKQEIEKNVKKQIASGSAFDRVLFGLASNNLYDKRKEVRCEGVRGLEELGNKIKVVIPIIVINLQDEDDDVRVQALESLIKLEAKETVPKFMEFLNDRNIRIRLAALRGIYKLAGKSAVPYLVRALKDENIEVRKHAATYLGHTCNNNAAVPGLIRLLDSPDDSIREACVQAISRIKDKSTVHQMISVLDDANADVRTLAASTLHRWTGETFGFKENDEKYYGENAIAQWEQWWSHNKDTFQISSQAEEVTRTVKEFEREVIDQIKPIADVVTRAVKKPEKKGMKKQKPKDLRKLDIDALLN